MIEVKITEDHMQQATVLAEDLGELRNSITTGDGNLAGFVGEVIVAQIMGASHSNTYDYDLVLPDGKTVDVKTKRTNYVPKEHYDCSVAAFNTRQKCDYYVFVRVKNDFSSAWILGLYSKADYFKDATFHRKGDYDSNNSFTFKADCYNIQISKLQGINSLMQQQEE